MPNPTVIVSVASGQQWNTDSISLTDAKNYMEGGKGRYVEFKGWQPRGEMTKKNVVVAVDHLVSVEEQ